MSNQVCNSFTAPINIVPTKENCDLMCEYNFEYNTSNVVAFNKGTFISVTYDRPPKAPVLFKGNNYFVKDFLICYPSLHTFNGNHTDGEIIITHTGEQGENNLVVCIPLKVMNETSKAAIDLEIIISQVSYHAAKQGESVHINTLNLDLNDFVPRKPYYFYNGTFQFNNCSAINNIIVFDYDYKAFVPITEESFNTLKNIISQQEYAVNTTNTNFFYNRVGPVENREDEIYIDCQPTGSDGEVLVQTPKGDANLITDELKQLQNSPIFNALIGVVLMVSLYSLGKAFFSRITSVKE